MAELGNEPFLTGTDDFTNLNSTHSESSWLPGMDAVQELAESQPVTRALKTPKKQKQRPNPLFINPLSPLSQRISARFPSELHDYIIDHLHNDRRTLCACTLVCRTWHATSTYHLFQNAGTIYVHRKNLVQVFQLLASQRLSAYIGRLNLESHVIGDYFDDGPNEMFQFNDDLQRFTGLPNLKYLRLYYHHDHLLATFIDALAQNFSSITDLELNSIHFESFAQFLQISDGLPHLRRLALVAVLWHDEDSDSTEDEALRRGTYTSLDNLVDVVLDSFGTTEVLLWLAHQPCIRRLAIGRLHRQSYVSLLSDVLRALGPCLEHLNIYTLDDDHSLDLSHTTALRTLQITGILLDTAAVARLPTLLSQLSSPVLQRIVLVVNLPARAGLDLLDFSRIAEVLAGMAGLRRLVFSLSAHRNWAAKTIGEKLGTRAYVLRVDQLPRRYQYGLSVFDV
ncbi:hypothetical protein C8R44DRAFT_882074 [Mycena epipterygia]|nr:hypothetical protein C8R44DRAFT_882074 [Mycena epipterygia]